MPIKTDTTQTAVISAGGTLSSIVRLNDGGRLEAIVLPSSFVSSDIYIQGEYDKDGNAFLDVYDANDNRVTMFGANADQYVALNSNVTRGLAQFKLETAQTQTSGATIRCVIQYEA